MKLIRCSYGEFSQHQLIGSIQWPFFDLLVVHQGQIELTVNNKTSYKLSRGEALLIYPNTPFCGKVLSATSLASVQHFSLSQVQDDFTPEYMSSLTSLSIGAKLYCLDSLVIADVERALSYNQVLLSPIYVQQMQMSLLHLILAQLFHQRNERVKNSRYKLAINELVDSYARKPEQLINIAQMATKVHLSQSHFRAEFFKLYGEPPQRYLLRLKMKAACQLLEQSQLPIKHISTVLGYQELNYFYRHFKNIIKTTPLIYRKQKQVIG